MIENPPDTEELLDRAGRHDLDAWQDLLTRHRDRLRRMVALRLDYTITDLGTLGGPVTEAIGLKTDLNSLIPAGSGWTLTFAKSVNNAGEIAGFGTVSGQVHAFLLTPTTTSLAQPSISAANWPTGISVNPNPGGPASSQRPDVPTALAIASLDPDWWDRSAELPTNPVSPSSLNSQLVDLALTDLGGYPRHRR